MMPHLLSHVGVEKRSSRLAHNQETAGSTPAAATKYTERAVWSGSQGRQHPSTRANADRGRRERRGKARRPHGDFQMLSCCGPP